MKKRLLQLASVTVYILSHSVVLNAQDNNQASPVETATSKPPSLSKQLPPVPDTPLEKQMKVLARGTKQLSLQVSNPSKQQENITLLETLRKAVIDSKGLNPRKASQIPQAELEKFLADYRAQLDKLNSALSQIEDAVKGGNYDRATTLMSTINPIKKEGHKNFKVD